MAKEKSPRNKLEEESQINEKRSYNEAVSQEVKDKTLSYDESEEHSSLKTPLMTQELHIEKKPEVNERKEKRKRIAALKKQKKQAKLEMKKKIKAAKLEKEKAVKAIENKYAPLYKKAEEQIQVVKVQSFDTKEEKNEKLALAKENLAQLKEQARLEIVEENQKCKNSIETYKSEYRGIKEEVKLQISCAKLKYKP